MQLFVWRAEIREDFMVLGNILSAVFCKGSGLEKTAVVDP